MKVCPTCSREFPDNVKFCPNDGGTLRAKAASADLVGQVVADRYHILKKLGEGGMGAVYLGEHVKMGRKSAIKVMAAAMAQDPDAISRFNREAANASRISHPNVCQVYDFGETPDGLIFLAMEFIEGRSLKDVVEEEGALPPARAGAIIRQAADALQAAHDLGIVHRDIKPDNIMIVPGRDGSDVVKVVDFGIARAVGGDEAGQKVTKTGLVVGTPEYMSPEQLSGDKLDGRSDLYSLGLVLYRLLTGDLPFKADSAQEVMIKRLTDEPMPLEEARPDIEFPPKMQLVLNSALARRADERYQSAAEFGRDVSDAVEGLASPKTRVGAPPEGATAVMSKDEVESVTRHQQAKKAPTKGGADRGTGRRSEPAPPPPTPPPGKKFPVAAVLGGIVVVGALGGGAVMMMKGRAGGQRLATSDSLRGPDTSKGADTGSPGVTKRPGTTRTPPTPGNPGTSPNTTATNPGNPPPAVAAWSDTLDAANRAFDDDQLGTARGLAQRAYDHLGGSQKASAAILVATTLVGSRPDDAVMWYRRAKETATAAQRDRIDGLLQQMGVAP